MTPEDAFLQSVLDDPDSDTPRLIFADWLEENGEPDRAAFIRAQCRLATLGEDDPARLELRREESAYLIHASLALRMKKGPFRLPAWAQSDRLTFERGYPARLWTTAHRFVQGAAALFRAAPIQHLTLNAAPRSIDALAACPHLERIRSLDLSRVGGALGWQELTILAASPHLAGLTRLGLSRHRAGIDGASELARSPGLAGLRSLDLTGNTLYDRGTEALASSEHLTNLESLDLSACRVGPRGATALAGSSALCGLRELKLAGNRLGDRGASILADSPRLTRLARLDVADNHIGQAGAYALLTSNAPGSLTHLALGGPDVDNDVWAISPAARMRGALHLTLRWLECQVGAMAQSPLLSGCAGLHLVNSGLGDRGVMELAQSPVLANLRELGLDGTGLRVEGVRALARSPHLGQLRRLSLASNSLHMKGLTALLEAPFLPRLTHLDLSSTEAPQGFGLLARSPALENIVELRLLGYEFYETPHRNEVEERFGTRVVFR